MKFLILFFVFVSFLSNVRANPDSLWFSQNFTTGLYFSNTFLGHNWYIHDTFVNKSSVLNRIENLFKYSSSDYFHSYERLLVGQLAQNLNINNTFNSLYNSNNYYKLKNINPIGFLDFQLNGINDTVYYIHTKDTMQNRPICDKTAIVMIPSSGNNQSYIQAWGFGISTLNCSINSNLQKFGDIYTIVKPNEDFLALRYGNKKLNMSFLESYLDSTGKKYGVNYIIQSIALVKKLKSTYKKVIVMGLSEGGYAALLNAIESEPELAVVASGYSVNLHNVSFGISNSFNRLFGDVFVNLDSILVKNKIEMSNTNFCFTYGINEGMTVFYNEQITNDTKNYYNGVNNVIFSTNHYGHTYPNCSAIDSIVNNTINQNRKAKFSSNYNCDSSRFNYSIKIQNEFPWYLYFQKNSNLDSVLLYNNYYMPNQDTILFLNVKDNDGCVIDVNQLEPNSHLSPIIDSFYTQYNCSNDSVYLILINENATPYYLRYSQGGNINSVLVSAVKDSIQIQNSNLLLINYLDSFGCSWYLNKSVDIDFKRLSLDSINYLYNCNTNLTDLIINAIGQFPIKLSYLYNTANNFIVSDTSFNLSFENGNLNLIDISDSNGCIINIAQNLMFDYDTLDVKLLDPVYILDSNKTLVNFIFQGNPPFKVFYSENGINKVIITSDIFYNSYFNNGIYFFDKVIDATGCEKSISKLININNFPLNAFISSPIYDCDSNKTHIAIQTTGNPPYNIYYSENLVSKILTTSNSSVNLYLPNGNYTLDSIVDFTNSVEIINLNYTFDFDTIGYKIITPKYNCLQNVVDLEYQLTGNMPFFIDYNYNNTLLQSISFQDTFTEQYYNGILNIISVKDNSGCMKNINQLFQFAYNPLTVQLTDLGYACDSNKTKVHFDMNGNKPFILSYIHDGVAQSYVTNESQFDLYLVNGTYNFLNVEDSTNCVYLLNDTFVFNYDTLEFNALISSYNCLTNTNNILLTLEGNKPFNIKYNDNGVLNNIQFNSFALDSNFDNSLYNFIEIADSTGCTASINQIVSFNNFSLTYQITDSQVVCDSNKTKYNISLFGNSPWQISYEEISTGQIHTINSIDSTVELYLSKGLYVLKTVADSKCIKYIADTLNPSYYKLSATIHIGMMSCDSNKRIVEINSNNGVPPYTLIYNKNSLLNQHISTSQVDTLLIDNGIYYLDKIVDDLGCITPINKTYIQSYEEPILKLIDSKFLCDSNITRVQFDVQTNSPLSLIYTKNSILDSFTLINGYNFFHLNNATYHLVELRDTANCYHVVDSTMYISNFLPQLNIQALLPNCVTKQNNIQLSYQGSLPYILDYNYSNNSFHDTIGGSIYIKEINSGTYNYVGLSDNNGCTLKIDTVFSFKEFLLDTPTINIISNQIATIVVPYKYTWYWNGAVVDTLNSFINSLGDGQYYVSILDSSNCTYLSDTLTLDYKNQVEVLPSISNNYIDVIINEAVKGEWVVFIYDLAGNIVCNRSNTWTSSRIDISNLSKGNYIVKVRYNNGAIFNIVSKKIIKI